MPSHIDKVTAFITRAHDATAPRDLLLFEHPSAGIEIPAGTVEPGEPVNVAVLRETHEETGLDDVTLRAHIITRTGTPPANVRIIAQTTPAYARPDRESWQWVMLPRGLWVKQQRRAYGYTQISYSEPDHLQTPDLITFAITAWVPDEVFAGSWRRHFFHLTHAGDTPDRWSVTSDGHAFTLFWAPLDDLPQLVPPQDAWPAVLRAYLAGTLPS